MSARVAVAGATGRMGQAILAVLDDAPDLELVGALAAPGDERLGETARGEVRYAVLGASLDADVLIDFTSPAGTAALAARCASDGVAHVCGTTGLGAPALEALDVASAVVPVVVAPNMSAGVTLLFHLAAEAARALSGFDAEIVEMHHRHKVDAPSGTALRLAERVAHARGLSRDVIVDARSGQVGARTDDEIGVMTLRGGGVVGEHTLLLAGEGERLELTHRALDRSVFARGAVRAARWVVGRSAGRYGMEDVLGVRSQ